MDRTVVLAIETSQRAGGVAVRARDGSARAEPLSPRKRHDDDLIPAIARLFTRAQLTPRDLRGVGVSAGPGGFTGLRIAVSCAKMLAMTLGVPLVAVPTALVVAESADAEALPGSSVLVALATKRETFWATTLGRERGTWQMRDDGGALAEPGSVGLEGVSAVIGDAHLPEAFLTRCTRSGLPVIEPRFDPVACLAVTERWLRAERTVDPFALAPIYARGPEAVRLWDGGAP